MEHSIDVRYDRPQYCIWDQIRPAGEGAYGRDEKSMSQAIHR